MIKILFLTIFCLIKCLSTLRNPLLFLSFDGLQSAKFEEFLIQNPNSNFSRIIRNGLKSDYLKPSTPTFTFPNHYTLITGLYPESNGIVNNVIYDPNYKEKGALKDNFDLKWYNSTEPIFYTAKKQGLKTASSFWISNNVWPRQPDIFLAFNRNYDPFLRIDELINWYIKFNLDFACMYFDEPDLTGHIYGPESNEYKQKIVFMDSVLGYLLNELERINILKKLNLIVASDHGMAQLDENQFIYLRDYVDLNLIDFDKSVIAIVSSIYPKTQDKLGELYEKLAKIPHMKVYLKNDIPKELHYSNNERIGPIVVFSDEGYRLMDKNYTYIDYGAHGYDANLTSMRAVFMAKGPNLRSGSVKPFENVNIYPLMCKLLEIKCLPNNGSLEIFEQYLMFNRSSKKNSSNFFLFVIFGLFIKYMSI